ncbi:interleukin 17a/f3 [Amphiprion ocellaris]|uniref:Interleukin 17a/f3 n=1 Tax=Amphiprion ocellaris TaxID=80972 RepID=A0A3Q1CCD7_AMPOC|nr:interleukin 17a/f3 [Amphiprion ocellaris]
MLLVFRALLLLGLVSLLHSTRRGHAVSVVLDQGGGPRGQTVRLVLDPSVLGRSTSIPGSSIANMSLSPWTYRDSFVASRLPRRISEAHCLTSGCLNLQWGEDAALEAKPVYYQALVFYRVPRPSRSTKAGKKVKKKKYDLRLGTEMIPVGCTCVRPSVVPQL